MRPPAAPSFTRLIKLLEMITLDKDTAHMKTKLAVDFADLLYNGKWFSPLREALSAFADKDPGVCHRHRQAQAL